MVERIVVLTGAGISAESGIRTFRDANGLWESHRIEQVASPEGWRADPELVWQFYSARRTQARKCLPNQAHRALAELEARMGSRMTLVTQNVDDLHERGGSQRVIHMHGQLNLSRCERPLCETTPFHDEGEYVTRSAIPYCSCGGRIRPHIVWFGEQPFEVQGIIDALEHCTLLAVIGSSGSVYPAAGFVNLMHERSTMGEKARTIYLGLEAPENADYFDKVIIGKASEIVPDWAWTIS